MKGIFTNVRKGITCLEWRNDSELSSFEHFFACTCSGVQVMSFDFACFGLNLESSFWLRIGNGNSWEVIDVEVRFLKLLLQDGLPEFTSVDVCALGFVNSYWFFVMAYYILKTQSSNAIGWQLLVFCCLPYFPSLTWVLFPFSLLELCPQVLKSLIILLRKFFVSCNIVFFHMACLFISL